MTKFTDRDVILGKRPIGDQGNGGSDWMSEEEYLKSQLKAIKDQKKENIRFETSINPDIKNIIELILEIRGLQKMISTYFQSTKELIYDVDGRVHPQFSHVQTDTSRLGCRAPNVQNQSG